jgi:hypothetical protein
MEFAYVEVLANAEFDENIFVGMEGEPGGVQLEQGFVAVGLEMGIVDEIQYSPDSELNSMVCSSGKDTKKYFFHIFALCTCPLGCEGNPFFEVTETGMGCHGAESAVDFPFPSRHSFSCPFHDMVTEDTIVKFV